MKYIYVLDKISLGNLNNIYDLGIIGSKVNRTDNEFENVWKI